MKITASFIVSVALLAIFGIPVRVEGGLACGVNEYSDNCGRSCEITCATLNSAGQIVCPDVCRPGCYCKNGFVRAYKNSTGVGPCVARKSCS